MNEQPFFEITTEEEKSGYTRFAISPLGQGYGHTLGTALRRVLLTSLPGAAITSVRIAGVKHQFSTLKGAKEDVIDFLLNLKKVRVSYEGEKPVTVSLKAEGPGEVKAGDIKTEGSVTIANPDLVIAVLSAGAKLDAQMEVQSGSGYSPADERATGEIGLVPLDALYSPIVRVDYKVEETRVGRVTNYDKLILEVWTDGTVDAKDALTRAAEILVSYYNQIVSPTKASVKKEEVRDDLGPSGKLSVEEIGLPTRVANALMKSGYESVEDLSKVKKEELAKVRNLGEKSVKVIVEALAEKGISLPNLL
jgi:DNA-directed RNA polymerase subunit alpha